MQRQQLFFPFSSHSYDPPIPQFTLLDCVFVLAVFGSTSSLGLYRVSQNELLLCCIIDHYICQGQVTRGNQCGREMSGRRMEQSISQGGVIPSSLPFIPLVQFHFNLLSSYYFWQTAFGFWYHSPPPLKVSDAVTKVTFNGGYLSSWEVVWRSRW